MSLAETLLETKLKEAEDALREASRALNSSKIWGGNKWTLNSIHPLHYRHARGVVNAYWTKRQAEVDSVPRNNNEGVDDGNSRS